MVKTKVIIDCDPGTDDVQAILIALACKEIEIVAVTTVFGNTSLENTVRNAVRLLKFCNRSDIPVYKGCSSSLLFEHRTCIKPYHGNDGFGDITIEGVDPVDMSIVSQEHASMALCRHISEQAGEITLLATGPLTNVAVALMLDPQLGTKLKNCVVMGGNYLGKGNVTASAEFNWFMDPEAAHSVLTGLNKLITVVPLETCSDSSFSWEFYDNAVNRQTRAAKLLRDADGFTVDIMNSREAPHYWAFDQLAMSVIVDPEIVLDAKVVYAVVELHGQHTRGQLVVDWNNKLEKTPNVRIVSRVDQTRYERVALTAFTVV